MFHYLLPTVRPKEIGQKYLSYTKYRYREARRVKVGDTSTSTTSSKPTAKNDQTTYQPTFYKPSVNKNDSGNLQGAYIEVTPRKMVILPRLEGWCQDRSLQPREVRALHQKNQGSGRRRHARQGAASRCNVERGPKREHLLTSAWAIGDLLSPN